MQGAQDRVKCVMPKTFVADLIVYVVAQLVGAVIGPAILVGGKAMADLWVFIAAPLAGGAMAGLLHRSGVTRAA